MVCQGKMVLHKLPRGRGYFECDECGIIRGNTARHPGRATCQRCGDFCDEREYMPGGSDQLTVMGCICLDCRKKDVGRGGD
ncbi:MAG: hypothetical protein J4F28_02125 [Nitrosopumilaceae archaeon]|nr:hypothetical protein [Nitrosopumilaceae archaeon]